MTAAIVKFDKDGLWEYGTLQLPIENVFDLTIPMTYDVMVSSSQDLPFLISVAEVHAPYIEEEMVVVIREKVDLTARGPNDTLIKNIGKDLGGENYIDSTPYRPKELPPGFEEVLKL
jgi:hypothetical protein